MPESKDDELSMDELKDVNGAGMGLDRLGTQFKGKKDTTNIYGSGSWDKSKGKKPTSVLGEGADDDDTCY